MTFVFTHRCATTTGTVTVTRAGPPRSVTKRATGEAWTAALLTMASTAGGPLATLLSEQFQWRLWKLGWFKCLQVTCAPLGSSGSGLGTGAPSVLRAKQMTKCGLRSVGVSVRASPQGHAAMSGCPVAPRAGGRLLGQRTGTSRRCIDRHTRKGKAGFCAARRGEVCCM